MLKFEEELVLENLVSKFGELERSNRNDATTKPIPGRFYHIQFGKGGLLTTAGRAYGVGPGGERLRLAQRINNHPLNRKFWVQPSKSFNKKFFPNGIVAFLRRFTCDDRQRRAPSGEPRCFPTIWIPPKKDPNFSTVRLSLDPSRAGVRTAALVASVIRIIQISCAVSSEQRSFLQRQIRGKDERKYSSNKVDKIPFRWNCLVITAYRISAGNFSLGRASGFLLTPDTLVTSAHVLESFIEFPPSSGSFSFKVPDFVIVVPRMKRVPTGFQDLSAALPSGFMVVPRTNDSGRSNFFVAPEWKAPGVRDALQGVPGSLLPSGLTEVSEVDYGVINLSNSRRHTTGSVNDSWMTAPRLLAMPAASARKKELGIARPGIAENADVIRFTRKTGELFTSGYPGDKKCSQWRFDRGRLLEFTQRKRPGVPVPEASRHNAVLHQMDIVSGASGSPVWVQQKVKGKQSKVTKTQRLLIGIVSSQTPLRISRRGLLDRACVITATVLRRLRNKNRLTAA